MLVITRTTDQDTILDFSGMTDEQLLSLRNEPVTVKIVDVRGPKVRLGFEAPRPLQIVRSELVAEAGGKSNA